MSYASLWAKNNITKPNAKLYIEKFGYLLKWQNCKENILDAGCGDGSVTAEVLYPYVKNHVQKILGIDKLDGMINYAKEHNNMKQIDYHVMDVMDQKTSTGFENQFRHIFAFHLAQWIPDTKSLLTGFHKMLKPNGQIFVVSLTDRFYLNQSFAKQFKEKKWTKYIPAEPVFANYTNNPQQYFANVLNDVGFELDVCDYEKKKFVIENFTDFLRAGFNMFEHFKRIPKDLQEEYFQEHMRNSREICSYVGEPDTYEAIYEPLILIATKKMKS